MKKISVVFTPAHKGVQTQTPAARTAFLFEEVSGRFQAARLYGRMVDALATEGEEGRDKLR